MVLPSLIVIMMLPRPSDGFAMQKCTCARDRTLFTRLIPCTSNVVGTAAHFLGHIEEQLTITGLIVSIVISITQTSSHICENEENLRPMQWATFKEDDLPVPKLYDKRN